MPDLTPLEEKVYLLRRDEDLTDKQLAARLGITRTSASSTWKRVRQKLGIPPRRIRDDKDRLLEAREPEQAAEFLDLVTEPGFENLAEAARECGLSRSAAQMFIDRIQGQYQPLAREAGRIKTDHLVRAFEQVSKRALEHITDEKLEELDAYKLTLVGAIAADKRELLDGRPTERISVEDRRALPEIMAILVKEAEQRGLMPEMHPETHQVRMTHREDAPYQVRAGRERMQPIDAEVS